MTWSVTTSATLNNPLYDIELGTCDSDKIGLMLVDGGGRRSKRGTMRQTPIQQTAMKTATGQMKWADIDSPWDVRAQDDWSGGRGMERYEDNVSRYLDGYRADTTYGNQVVLGGQATYTTGYLYVDQVMPGDLSWHSLDGGAGDWKSVVPPTGWTWTLPFTIQRMGSVFRVDPNFVLQTYAGITVTTTYYVDKATGSDSNTGLSWAQAFKTFFNVVRNCTDVDRVYVKPGWYFYDEAWSWYRDRHMEIIGVGSGVYLTSDVYDELGAFTLDTTHYEFTVPAAYTLTDVQDALTLNSFGDPTSLTNVANEAAVEATGGTWCQTGTTLFIHNFGDREPDTNNRYYRAGYANLTVTTDKTLYVENITFAPGFYYVPSAAATAATVYFKDVVAQSYIFQGQNEIILQNCRAKSATGDCYNYKESSEVIPKVIEIDCEGYNISTGGADQASTCHDGVQIVRINGVYHDVSGQCIADVDATTNSWNLGCEIYNSRVTLEGVYSGGTMWLDRCNIHDVITDLENEAATTIYTLQVISGGNFVIAGTKTEYTDPTDLYIARSFTASAAYTAANIEIWVKRLGTPTGTLTVALYTDAGAGANPTTIIGTGGVATTTLIWDTVSTFHKFTVTPGAAFTASTIYWVVAWQTAGTPTSTDCWQVGCLADNGTSTMTSTDGTAWTASTVDELYFRVTATDYPFIARFFEYKGSLFIATYHDNQSTQPGKVYQNGTCAFATTNAAAMNKLTDTKQAWTTNQYADCVVQIWDGEGVQEKRNWRKIISNTATALTVDASATGANIWNIIHTPAGFTGDETHYNILGSDVWTQLYASAATGMGYTDVQVADNIVYLARGEGAQNISGDSSLRNLQRMYLGVHYSESDADAIPRLRFYFADEPGVQATFLESIYKPTVGHELWLGSNDSPDGDALVSRALVPVSPLDELLVTRPYISATPTGFMMEYTGTCRASDSFYRAGGDTTTIGNTDGDGHSWGYPCVLDAGSAVTWTETAGQWTIASSKLVSPTSGSNNFCTVDGSEADITVRAAITIGTHATNEAGLVAMYTDSTHYLITYIDKSDQKVYIHCHSGATDENVGTAVELVDSSGTGGHNWAYADGGKLVLKIDGNYIKVYYKGIQDPIREETYSHGLTGTRCGLYHSGGSASTFDDFLAYDTFPLVQLYEHGAYCARIDIPDLFTTGLLCTDIPGITDWRRFNKVRMNVRSEVALAAGALQLRIDDSAKCASTIYTMSFPALQAGKWTPFDLDIDVTATTGADALLSAGIYLNAGITAPTIIYISKASNEFQLIVDTENIPLGDRKHRITNMLRYGDPQNLWVLTEGSVFEIQNDIPVEIPLREIEAVRSHYNGQAALVHDVYLYFSMLYGLQQYYRQNLVSMGPNLDYGLPASRQGAIADMVGYPGKFYVAIDGGTDNFSSVLACVGGTWHEAYRAPRAGDRIRKLYIQPIPGVNSDRLWISMGSAIIWIPLPSFTTNPYNDDQYRYTHESTIETGWIDCGLVNQNKTFYTITLHTENLTADAQYITLDYQVDEVASAAAKTYSSWNANTTAQTNNWTPISTQVSASPVQEVTISSPGASVIGKRVRFRFHLYTTDDSKTPLLRAWVLKTLTSVFPKYAYTFSTLLADGKFESELGKELDDPTRVETGIAVLKGWIENKTLLYFRNIFSAFDNKTVLLQDYTTTSLSVNPDEQIEQEVATLTVYEA